MITAHYDAVKAQMETDAGLAGKVEDTTRLDKDGIPARETYAVLYGGGPDDLDDYRLSSEQRPDSDAEFVYTVRSISTDPDGAKDVAGRAFAKLVGAHLTIPGRTCAAIRHTGSDPVTEDRTVKPPIFYCDDEYTLNSSRS